MARVGEPRAHDAAIAGRDRRAAVAGDKVRHQDEPVGEAALAVDVVMAGLDPAIPFLKGRRVDGRLKAGHDGRGMRRGLPQDKALLVRPDRRADHLGRNVEERRLEFAHQHDRPFDEARNLLEQALVFDELEPLREGEAPGVGENDRLAAVGVEHDPGLLQRLGIGVVVARHDRLGRHEAMAPGHVAGGEPVDVERDDLGDVVRRRERAEDPAQGTHPAQGVGLRRPGAPAHRFRPGEDANDGGNDLGERLFCRAAGLLDCRDIELALLRVLLDRSVLDPREARALEEALDRRLRRADAGSLALLARGRLGGGQSDHMQGEAPRRDESLRALVDEIALDEGVGHEALQVVGRLPLHAGGDFFAEEFEEKIGHVEKPE